MSQIQATFPFPLPAEPRTTAAASRRIGSGRPGGGGEQVKEAAHLSHKLEACGGHSEGHCPDPPSRPGHPELIPVAQRSSQQPGSGNTWLDVLLVLPWGILSAFSGSLCTSPKGLTSSRVPVAGQLPLPKPAFLRTNSYNLLSDLGSLSCPRGARQGAWVLLGGPGEPLTLPSLKTSHKGLEEPLVRKGMCSQWHICHTSLLSRPLPTPPESEERREVSLKPPKRVGERGGMETEMGMGPPALSADFGDNRQSAGFFYPAFAS